MRREHGFTLIELLVAMAMFIFVIAAASSLFTSVLTQFKQQSKTAETQIEGIIGLELLRRDITHAGFGLPWNMNGGTYTEAGIDNNTLWVDRDFNDGPPNNPMRGTELGDPACNPPGAIRSDKGSSATLGGSTLYDSDVLVLKGANLARNDASQKWTRLGAGNIRRNDPNGQGNAFENLSGDAFCDNTSIDDCDAGEPDRVIVISPGSSDASRRSLELSDEADGASWRTTYNATAAFAPTGTDIDIIYGIKSAPDGGGAVTLTDPQMPFNRTDYYIRIPTTSPMPNQCAAGTGILYRSEINHDDGEHGIEYPIFDCVADFQVGYTDNGGISRSENFSNGLTAAQIRDQVRTVTVSILAQEGQRDSTNCTIANPCIANPVTVGPNDARGRSFDFTTYGITDWQNYHWKVYTFSVTLENLR